MTPYEQGFMSKCAELGVDPVALIKSAQQMAPYGAYAQAGQQFRTMAGVAGQWAQKAWNAGKPGGVLDQKIKNPVRSAYQYMNSNPGMRPMAQAGKAVFNGVSAVGRGLRSGFDRLSSGFRGMFGS